MILKGSGKVNAWTSFRSVTITSEMIKRFKNKDEVSMVLGHELGHWHNKDYLLNRHIDKNMHYKIEYRADMFGAKITEEAKYNRCRGAKWFYWFIDVTGDSPSFTHPQSILRKKRLSWGCKR